MEQIEKKEGFWAAVGRFFKGWLSAGRCCSACDLPWNKEVKSGEPGVERKKEPAPDSRH